MRTRRFYFAINQNGEISSSLEKSAKEYVAPRSARHFDPQPLRKANSSKEIYKSSFTSEISHQTVKASKEFETRIIQFGPQDTFLRTQSSEDTRKVASDITSLPAIGSIPESPPRFMRGRSNRSFDPAPQQAVPEISGAKMCYYSVSAMIYLLNSIFESSSHNE